MNKAKSLQDAVLNAVRKERIAVTMHLLNGVPLKGHIRGFDNFVVVLEGEGKQMMVYKHAISTITPMRAVMLNPEFENADMEADSE